MASAGTAHQDNRPALTALMIAPDRGIAARFSGEARKSGAFQVLAELRAYPPREVLEVRLRQLRPQVALVELATDLESAAACVESASARGVAVIALHTRADSAVIRRSVSAGVREFLFDPFEAEAQRQARDRVARHIAPVKAPEREPGKVILFCPAKAGSGASTVAAQTAFALAGAGARVLSADFDAVAAGLSFQLAVRPRRSLQSILGGGDSLERWPEWVERAAGVDALGSDGGECALSEPRLIELLDRMRAAYDCIVLDMPPVFSRTTLLALAQSDLAFIVSGANLASLHLARKAAAMLLQAGVEPGRFKVLVNRREAGTGLSQGEMSRIVDSPVAAVFPNDTLAVEEAVARCGPLESAGELAAAVRAFASGLWREVSAKVN